MARRVSLLLLLVLCLGLGSPLLGAPNAGKGVPQAPRGAYAQTIALGDELLRRFWQRLTVLWAAEGCAADPNGVKCAAAPAGGNVAVHTPLPAGCGADPDSCR